jgi:aspartyl-tRNA(Asn)/glutamyl-tRNA(Gln) amidotransferase subunit B
MRSKEDAQDYRYFPDPDLLPLQLSEAWIEEVGAALPELPQARRERYVSELGLPAYDAGVLTSSREISGYFEDLVRELPGQAKLCANWVMVELSGRLNREDRGIAQSPVPSRDLAGLLRRIADGTLSGKLAKDVFDAMWAGQGDADRIIAQRGLKQISDASELEKLVDDVLAANPAQAAEYRAGKDKAFNFLVGQAMKASRGKANPAQVSQILSRKLSAQPGIG